MFSMTRRPTLALVAALLAGPAARGQDVNEDTEKAMKAAVARVAPSVVRIETNGGQDTIVWRDQATGAPIRKVSGPTTGLVVDKDGYVITSSFNFINKPTDIVVTSTKKERSVAKVVGTDTSRMLTLLKVELKDLPVPEAAAKKDITEGQWSLALGRTLQADVTKSPTVSAGIIRRRTASGARRCSATARCRRSTTAGRSWTSTARSRAS